MKQREYDSTVARIAGNILGGMARDAYEGYLHERVEWAVMVARKIVAETTRTEPQADKGCP